MKVNEDDGETRRVRRKAFSKLIREGAGPDEAQERADSVSTEEEFNVVFPDEIGRVEQEMSRE